MSYNKRVYNSRGYQISLQHWFAGGAAHFPPFSRARRCPHTNVGEKFDTRGYYIPIYYKTYLDFTVTERSQRPFYSTVELLQHIT